MRYTTNIRVLESELRHEVLPAERIRRAPDGRSGATLWPGSCLARRGGTRRSPEPDVSGTGDYAVAQGRFGAELPGRARRLRAQPVARADPHGRGAAGPGRIAGADVLRHRCARPRHLRV